MIWVGGLLGVVAVGIGAWFLIAARRTHAGRWDLWFALGLIVLGLGLTWLSLHLPHLSR